MRIGIIALLHESNTFSSIPTTLESFQQDLLLTENAIRDELAATHHEVGGFFCELDASGADAIPLFAARALPAGPVTRETFITLVNQMLTAVDQAGPLDGILVAPHGAMASEDFHDGDGEWLMRLRRAVGSEMPIVATLDAHANLSRTMVESCNAIIGYRTNPHTDQRERGREAAKLLINTVDGEIRPTMTALFPPLAISIDRQCTRDPHLQTLYRVADQQLADGIAVTNSIVLGFPYADVAEMGSSIIAVTNGDQGRADQLARSVAERIWADRRCLQGEFLNVEQALQLGRNSAAKTVCLLDMGDNVGGGSSADGTELVTAIHQQRLGPSFACLFDPQAVVECESVGEKARVHLNVGGKIDDLHGPPVSVDVTVRSIHDGRFVEEQPRHGGIARFDQGRTAICATDHGLTLMITSRRMVPFSLRQMTAFGLDPRQFRFLVAKGVNAPIAAYAEVTDRFIRVNTRGATCADMRRLTYRNRRRPIYPLEPETKWHARTSQVVHGHRGP